MQVPTPPEEPTDAELDTYIRTRYAPARHRYLGTPRV